MARELRDNPADPSAASTGHSIRKNAFYAVLGNGVLNLARLAVFAIVAKFATPEVPGTLAYASGAWAAPVVLFFGLQLRPALVADTRGEFAFGVYRALRRVTMGLAALALLAIVLAITRGESDPYIAWFMLAVCAGQVVLHAPEVYWGVYQRRERLDLLAWSNALRGLAMLAPFVVFFVLLRPAGQNGTVEADSQPQMRAAAGAAWLYVLAWIAVWWFLDRRCVIRDAGVDFSWNWPAVWKLATQTFPLGLVLLLIGLCETVTQWFVKRAGGDQGMAELGYFGALRILTLIAMFLVVQISTAASNRLAHSYRQDLPTFLRLTGRLTGVALVLGAGMLLLTWLFGEWVLRVLYKPEYAQHYPEFLILIAGQALVLLAAVFGIVTTHMRRFWIQVPIHLSVLASTNFSVGNTGMSMPSMERANRFAFSSGRNSLRPPSFCGKAFNPSKQPNPY